MNDKQKLIFRQIQLVGLGGIIALFGLMNQAMHLCYVGLFVIVLGILRVVLMLKLVKRIEDEE